MIHDKTSALIAHDSRKTETYEWVNTMSDHNIYRLAWTGMTGSLIENRLNDMPCLI